MRCFKNKPGRTNRCVRSGFVCNRNVFRLFWALFGGFSGMVTDGRTNRPSYRDAMNDDLSDLPPVFKAIRIGSECYHDDRHGDICLKIACDP